MEKRVIDLRTDTSTLPTEEMLEAMRNAILGNDGFGEDPTVNRLQEMAAEKMGKEAALFVPSGTLGNLSALMCYTRRGDEIIAEENTHIFTLESGFTVVSGLVPRKIPGRMGIMSSEDVEEAILSSRKKSTYTLGSSLICLENTHNIAGGIAVPPANTREICEIAGRYDIPVHLDGARVFNAAVALGTDVKDLVRHVDSVMFCLSKGLCAPVGSILAGSQEVIAKAVKVRKILGGGMRQAGVLAAAGIIALKKMVTHLVDDHKKIRVLAQGFSSIEGLLIDWERVQTNILHFDVKSTGLNAQTFIEKLNRYGIRFYPRGKTLIRAVAHKDVTEADIQYVIEVVREVLLGIRQ
ncbi:MAG: threonine aldolase [Nitrososphaeria archaeon]|nr:threonine aldolase [Nitrososphaeria archaeon]NIN53548.1 threonine aldolase [Nitrososphaeria archaeon]NIQ34067.1 threonine aldolase [Nitrososphaeria archaeon]